MTAYSLNPNHPMVRKVDEQWHKLCALAMIAMGTDHVTITAREVHAMAAGIFITIQEDDSGLHIRLVSEAEAHRLARENGGLPQ